MSADVFKYTLRVRYHETDQQKIVYHSRYLEYLDIAMTEYIRHLGWDYDDFVASGCDPSLVRTTLEFVLPAVFDEEIEVSVMPSKIGNSSYTLKFLVTRCEGRERLLDAETIYVNFDPATQRSRPLPDRFRDKLKLDLK